MFWLNTVAPKNIEPISVTLAVFNCQCSGECRVAIEHGCHVGHIGSIPTANVLIEDIRGR